jgi:hypothetical protein
MTETYSVCERNFLGVSRVPEILGCLGLLDSCLASEGGDDAGHSGMKIKVIKGE